MARAVDIAYETVLEQILTGVHAVGGRLREEELAATIGISRTPVREALQRLHAEGLVEVLPNRGAVVVDLGDEDLDDIFELRFILEGYGARRAAARATEEDVAILGTLCTQMEECLERTDLARFDEISRLNLKFHGTIYLAGGNRRLSPLLSSITLAHLVRRTFSQYSPEQLNRSFAHHRELVEAINAGNESWAQGVMHAHVSAARTSLRRGSEENEDT